MTIAMLELWWRGDDESFRIPDDATETVHADNSEKLLKHISAPVQPINPFGCCLLFADLWVWFVWSRFSHEHFAPIGGHNAIVFACPIFYAVMKGLIEFLRNIESVIDGIEANEFGWQGFEMWTMVRDERGWEKMIEDDGGCVIRSGWSSWEASSPLEGEDLSKWFPLKPLIQRLPPA